MSILGDARFGVRNLTRSPGFTIVVILTLALGIGASAAIFSVVNAVILRPLAYPEADQLVRITGEMRNFNATDTGVAAAELFDYQARTDLFAAVAGVAPVSANITSATTPERLELLLVSWNYFDVLRVPPAHGRTFAAADDTPGVANIAVVSDSFWRRRLGADPRAVGTTVTIDNDIIEIVGIMPPGFRHPGRTMQSDVEVWSPAGFRGAGGAPSRSRRRLEGALARLQPHLTLEQVEARLHEYGAAVSREFPGDYPAGNGWRPRVIPLHEDLVGRVATPMFVLLSGVGLLLLVACVNVAHLVLARTAARRQELAVRRALGATGARLAVQLLTESALLAVGGGALAVLVASWVLRGLVALAPGQLPRLQEVRLDIPAVALIGLVALAVTVLFGVVPALRGRRAQVVADLKDGGPGRSSDGRSRARGMLVAAEVAIATVLLVGAGLFVRTVVGLLQVPVGFETDRLLTARMTLPRPNDPSRAAYLDHDRRATFARETLRRVSAISGVERAALATQIPLGGFNPPLFVEIDGPPQAESRGGDASARTRPVMHNFLVSPEYFATLGVPIVAGRSLQHSDRAGAEPVAVVSETAARTFWPRGTAVGGRLRLGPGLPWLTVVGVAGDVLNRRLTEQPQPILYQPLEQSSDLTMALLVRVRPGAEGVGAALARAVTAVDADVPLYAIRTMDELIEGGVAQRRFLMRLLVVFGGLATTLALLGIYGVMSYSVSQRTREIGIRMAIGARQSDVARMVLQRGLALTASGAVAGVVASLALTRLVESQLFGVRPSDPVTIGCVLLLMLAVALFAAWWPARRAASIDPIAALRAH